MKYFSTREEKFCISVQPCTITSVFFLSTGRWAYITIIIIIIININLYHAVSMKIFNYFNYALQMGGCTSGGGGGGIIGSSLQHLR